VATETEVRAMRRALELAATPGMPTGPNPRVGCVVLAADGSVAGEGFHRGTGTAHAEVAALAAAGERARGGTAVVTLEPCDHTGRTGPCTRALLDAGVVRVVFGQADSGPVGAGGAATLRAAGVVVEGGVLADAAAALNEAWSFAVRHHRPFVTWKLAASLDGRVAAADGSSRWITGPQARADAHLLRAEVDAVAVGTGTALADDPQLTVRDGGGRIAPAARQPLRVVIGTRALPSDAHLLDASAPTAVYPTRDLAAVLDDLYRRDVEHLLLEGGPTLAGAFLAAGLVDRVVAYLAPVLLGAGPAALAGGGIATIAEALRLDPDDVTRLGPDLRVTARVRRPTPPAPPEED
jgi:diaminohydroxyphosphoribosylaminopyrimidine deaminase/5-amino-6-(5-phosphoribosylamino)uracil reductase